MGQGDVAYNVACLQDLSQARQRWGEAAADGFLSLFQTKLILSGIADSRMLEAISLALGEYDRRLVSYTVGRSQSEKLLPPPRQRLRERDLPHAAPPHASSRGSRAAAERTRPAAPRNPLGAGAAYAVAPNRALGDGRAVVAGRPQKMTYC